MKAGVSTRDMTFPELIGNPPIHDPLFAKVFLPSCWMTVKKLYA